MKCKIIFWYWNNKKYKTRITLFLLISLHVVIKNVHYLIPMLYFVQDMTKTTKRDKVQIETKKIVQRLSEMDLSVRGLCEYCEFQYPHFGH